MCLNKESLIKKGNKKGELIIKHATMMCFKAKKCAESDFQSLLLRGREKKRKGENERLSYLITPEFIK